VRPLRADAMTLLNYGKYALISNIGDKVIFASDSIVIGMYLPIAGVTYFAIGSSLIDYFRSFIISLGAMLNPLSSSLQAHNDDGAISRVVMTSAKMMIVLGLPVCIGFVVLGGRFIGLWMGEEYGGPAGTVLAILGVGHLLGLPYYTISGVLHGLGKHRIIAQSRVFEAVANLGLSLLLVGPYGIAGVAVGTVIPHVIAVVGILPLMLPRLVVIDLREYYRTIYVRPLLSAVPFAAACWLVRTVIQPADLLSFFGWIALALPVYLVPCWAIALSSPERALVQDAVRRRLQPGLA
jgi:O-antigen/teichoic acid export membrane protein